MRNKKITNLKFLNDKMFKILFKLLMLLASLRLSYQYKASLRVTDYCLDHELGEFVANPLDCKLFYLCGRNGEAVLASCPPNMLFNPETKLCDNPENVECEVITPSDTTAISTPMEPSTTLVPSTQAEQYCYNLNAIQRNSYALVFLPHPDNCHQYYMCYHGHALLQACSPKLHWNSKLSKCDLPSNAECLRPGSEDQEGEESMALDTNMWQEGIKCPSYGEHIFPNIKRCESFIYCVKGHAILQTCPFYQYFDVEAGHCRWRVNAKCVKDLNLKYGRT